MMHIASQIRKHKRVIDAFVIQRRAPAGRFLLPAGRLLMHG